MLNITLSELFFPSPKEKLVRVVTEMKAKHRKFAIFVLSRQRSRRRTQKDLATINTGLLPAA